MNKKMWVEPKLNSLSAENTNYGTEISTKPDAVIQVGKYTFYSFEDDTNS